MASLILPTDVTSAIVDGRNTLLPTDITIATLNARNLKGSIICTSSGQHHFGIFPHVSDKFPSGKICLKLGFGGQGRFKDGAYGLRHIWEKHRQEISAKSALDIVLFLEKVISAGAEVIIDNTKDPDKPLILESKSGMAVVAINGGNYYITSAYDRKSHKGTVVGNL